LSKDREIHLTIWDLELRGYSSHELIGLLLPSPM